MSTELKDKIDIYISRIKEMILNDDWDFAGMELDRFKKEIPKDIYKVELRKLKQWIKDVKL